MLNHNPNFRWIVSQEGTRQSYGVPVSFQKLGCLRLFYTDVWCRHGRGLLRRGPASARALATRYHEALPPEKVVDFSLRGVLWRRQHFRLHNLSPEEKADLYIKYGQWFASKVRDRLARLSFEPEHDLFFGFNTNSLETMELLKQKGIVTVLDQIDPGQVEEEMVHAEAKQWPGWEKLPGLMPERYWRRLRSEWQMADVILVNSEWSRDALVRQGVARERMIVVPLAIDLHAESLPPPIQANGRLKVLWLGSVILRKGIQYLIEAARLLCAENIEFVLVGPVGVSEEAVASFPPNVKVMGRVTRDQLSAIYREGHVFVLPTISDGFAITQLEAMAHGLPVVATLNCGRVITDGVEGLVVPARDGAALARALARLNADRQLITEMSHNALETVKKYDLPSNARQINAKLRSFQFGHGNVADLTLLGAR